MTPAQLKTVEWIARGEIGEIGESSKQLALWIAFGLKSDRGFGIAYPHDPDDLDRCLKYLLKVPEARADLYRMAELSPVWKALVERWDEIETSHLEEVGLGWHKARKAPKTYALMRSIIDPVEQHATTFSGDQ